MKVAELRQLKADKKIETSSNGDTWFGVHYSNTSTLKPAITLSGDSEEYVVTKIAEFIDSIGFEQKEES